MWICTILLATLPALLPAQQKDTAAVLMEKIVVTDYQDQQTFGNAVPTQILSQQTIRYLNAPSIGDAMRYYSGVLVKDYGGVGGLKTVSVRGLGASNTGILYDGMPVADVQTGQIDLSRFSSTFLKNMTLYQANTSELLTPARSFAAASLLEITTNNFRPDNFSELKWKGQLIAGSFGLWQPSGGIFIPTGRNTSISANAEGISSKGNYPYEIDNGNFSETAKRSNSEVKSFQGEINFTSMFRDSSRLQVKARGYDARRGLPGAIIFFNPRSVQKLWNRDYAFQARYQRRLSRKTDWLLLAGRSHTYTRYTDPDFQNSSGGLDDRYTQNEYYLSISAATTFSANWTAAIASDIAYTGLTSDKVNFVKPSRLSLWDNISVRYKKDNWKVTTSLLYNHFSDKAEIEPAADNRTRLNPTASVSYRPSGASPFMFRAFYKESYRLPTFNDLYYNFIGNRNLRPENDRQLNLGITYTHYNQKILRRISWSIDGYINRIHDKIIAVPNQNLFNWSMLNLGKVKITGVDLNAETNLVFAKRLTVLSRLAVTGQRALDITNAASATYKNRIPYTPDYSGSAFTIVGFKQWKMGYSLLFSGKRYALGANDKSNRLNGWLTHDLNLSRDIKIGNQPLSINVALNNFTNKKYDIVRYFPMPGRTFRISILINNF